MQPSVAAALPLRLERNSGNAVRTIRITPVFLSMVNMISPLSTIAKNRPLWGADNGLNLWEKVYF